MQSDNPSLWGSVFTPTGRSFNQEYQQVPFTVVDPCACGHAATVHKERPKAYWGALGRYQCAGNHYHGNNRGYCPCKQFSPRTP